MIVTMGTRIITAVIGIAIAIGVLFLSATPVFNLTVSAIAVIMLYELLTACDCIKHKFHSIVCVVFAAVMPFLAEFEGMEMKYIVSTSCIFLVFVGYIAEHKTISFEKICCMLAVTLLSTLSMRR